MHAKHVSSRARSPVNWHRNNQTPPRPAAACSRLSRLPLAFPSETTRTCAVEQRPLLSALKFVTNILQGFIVEINHNTK